MGMMLTFPTPTENSPASNHKTLSEAAELTIERAVAEAPNLDVPDVLAPYSLEAPGTWYICALAVFPEFRGQGIGTQFLALAHQQAAARGFAELSLLCFEQNTGAFRLYQQQGFHVIDRALVIPHPLIHHTGDILLMTTPVHL